MKKESDDRADRLELRREVISVLERQGISVSEENVPYEKIELRHASIKLPEDNAVLATAVLGEVQETVSSENTVYSSENGNMMFSNDSFSIVSETGKEIKNAEEAKALAKDIADKLRILYNDADITAVSAAGGYEVEIPQVFGSVRAFDAEIKFNISNSGNVLVNGKFIGKGRLVRVGGDTMEISALLLEFADEIRQTVKDKVEITGLDYGYTPRTPAGGRVYLVPTLEISTDAGVFYLDMSDGKIIGK